MACRPVFCTLGVLIVSLVYADYDYGQFSGSCYTFLETGVRSRADSLSFIISVLPPGSLFEVVSRTDSATAREGLISSWYEISFQRNGDRLSGYAPGSSFAFAGTELADGSIFIAGVTGFESGNRGCSAEARIVINGLTAASSPLPMPCDPWGQPGKFDYTVKTEVPDGQKLEGVLATILLDFVYEACGYENMRVPLFWTGEELVLGPWATSVSEAMLFRQTESLEVLTERNQLEIRRVIEQWDDSAGSYTVVSDTTMKWLWQGSEFNEN